MVSVQVGGGGDGDNLKEETLRDFVRVVVEGVVELREGVGVDEGEEVSVFSEARGLGFGLRGFLGRRRV